MRPECGTVLDNYKLLARVGTGSCGEVWQAENIVSGELVALKILINRELAERELRALELYRELQHPALIRIRHIGQVDETFFYTMDWCESSLAERKISAEELRETARRLTEGLILLHEHGLLHRDIKPANIFFRQGNPVLGDIGLLTRQEGATFAGSPGFLTPAILSGKSSADCYSDCYALAKSIYCALSGQGPEAFPMYTGEMTPAASLLMRAVIAVCREVPAIRNAAEFLEFLNHPPENRRSCRALWWSGLAAAVCAAGGIWWWWRQYPSGKPQFSRTFETVLPSPVQPSYPDRVLPPVQPSHPDHVLPPVQPSHPDRVLLKTESRVSGRPRQEIEKSFTALPPAAAEKLRRLRLEKEVSDLLGSPGRLQIAPEKEQSLRKNLSSEQWKCYQECCARLQTIQSSAQWRKIEKQWRQQYFEYHAQIRKTAQEHDTDAMSALHEHEEHDPLLRFRIRQAQCLNAQRSLLDSTGKTESPASRLAVFSAAVQECERTFRDLHHQR